MESSLLIGHSVARRIDENDLLPLIEIISCGGLTYKDLKETPKSKHKEFVADIKMTSEVFKPTVLIVLLGDNDFFDKKGNSRLTTAEINNPEGTAKKWIETSTTLADQIGAKFVLLTMCHARIYKCERSNQWRFELLSFIYFFVSLLLILTHQCLFYNL